jgi:hypothetical protein
MVDLTNGLNWNLLKRESYRGQIIKVYPDRSYDFYGVPDVQVVCRSPILLVGVRSTTAPPHWKLGCFASQHLPFIPSSTTEFAAAVNETQEQLKCRLGLLNKIQFPYSGIYPYILNLAFPIYIEQISIEVWQYGEASNGSFEPPYTDSYTLAAQIALIAQRDIQTTYQVE